MRGQRGVDIDRHTASALRLVVEGTGTNTAVNGGHQEVRETFVAGATA